MIVASIADVLNLRIFFFSEVKYLFRNFTRVVHAV